MRTTDDLIQFLRETGVTSSPPTEHGGLRPGGLTIARHAASAAGDGEMDQGHDLLDPKELMDRIRSIGATWGWWEFTDALEEGPFRSPAWDRRALLSAEFGTEDPALSYRVRPGPHGRWILVGIREDEGLDGILIREHRLARSGPPLQYDVHWDRVEDPGGLTTWQMVEFRLVGFDESTEPCADEED